MEVRVVMEVVVVVEVWNGTAEVEEVFAFGVELLQTYGRKLDRLEVWLWMAG